MTAMNRYRMMTQTTMKNSTAEVGFEVPCVLRSRSRRGVAFSDDATRRRVQRTPPGITAGRCPLAVTTTSWFSLIVPSSLSVLYKAPTAGAWSRWWRASGWDRGEAPFDRPAANARVRRRRHRGGGGGSRPKIHARTMPLVPPRPSSRARSLAHALARALVVRRRRVHVEQRSEGQSLFDSSGRRSTAGPSGHFLEKYALGEGVGSSSSISLWKRGTARGGSCSSTPR